MKDETPELPYWSQLNDSISLAMALGLTNNDRFNFQDTSIEESKKIRQSIVTEFEKIILKRDQMGVPRQYTVNDCCGMTVTLHDYLSLIGIKSLVVTGDMLLNGNPVYKTTTKSLIDEISNPDKENPVNCHAWLMLSNFMIIDPTLHLKTEFKDDFINGKTIGLPFIEDIEDLPHQLTYIPMITGPEFLAIINLT